MIIKKDMGNFVQSYVFFKFKRNKKNNNFQQIIKVIRGSTKYSDWRLKVFERDRFTCQKCGAKGVELNAHHIKQFIQIIKELEQQYPLLDLYDIAMMSKELWDINNGITLCKKCHKKVHNEKNN
jgi:5-methylcytosine-specific restriction endonuclease McrA